MFHLSLTSAGLKHVSDDQKTHKNPNLRSQGAPVRSGPKPFASSATRPAASATPTRTLPPVLELEGKKWKVVRWRGQNDQNRFLNLLLAQTNWSFFFLILFLHFLNICSLQENHEGAQNLVISDTELKQVVYAFKCNKSTLQVKGKINSITLGKKGNSLLRNTRRGLSYCPWYNAQTFIYICRNSRHKWIKGRIMSSVLRRFS